MRIYNYLIFRLYSFYTINLRRKDQPLLTVSILSTIIIWYNAIAVYGILRVLDFIPKYSNYTIVAIIMMVLMILNYLYVKREVFKEYGFKRDLKGGIIVIFYIIISVVLFFVSVFLSS